MTSNDILFTEYNMSQQTESTPSQTRDITCNWNEIFKMLHGQGILRYNDNVVQVKSSANGLTFHVNKV